MKLTRLFSTAALSLLLGSTAFLYAQDEHNEPKPQEPRQDEARPQPEAAKPEREAKPPKQDEAKPPKQDETKPREEMKPKQDEMKPKQDDSRPRAQEDSKAPKQGDRVQQQNRDQHQASQGRGHIPDDKFHSHFGRQHTFTVKRTTIIEGRPRFDYGGYSFELVEAWPAEWAYSDDCYVDYIDGEYFLFDLLHPGIRLAIVVIM